MHAHAGAFDNNWTALVMPFFDDGGWRFAPNELTAQSKAFYIGPMHLQLPTELGPVSGKGRLLLEYGSYAGRHYRLALDICPNPCCECQDLKVLCTPEDPPATSIGADPLCLTMDLDQRKISVHSQKEMDAAQHLGQALLQEIAPVHWQLLELDERFLAVKRRLTETDDLTNFTPTFPLDAQTDGGSMVAYYVRTASG
jgi:hypothetical protein